MTHTDLLVDNHGSIFLLRPLSQAGADWVKDHLPDDVMRWGYGPMAGVVVEHRYIGAIVDGAQADGLTVE